MAEGIDGPLWYTVRRSGPDVAELLAHDPLLEEFKRLEAEVAERERLEDAAEAFRKKAVAAEELRLKQAACQHQRLTELPKVSGHLTFTTSEPLFGPIMTSTSYVPMVTRPYNATHRCVDCGMYLPPSTEMLPGI